MGGVATFPMDPDPAEQGTHGDRDMPSQESEQNRVRNNDTAEQSDEDEPERASER